MKEANERGDPPVTVSVSRRPKPGRQAEFEEFVSGITAAASRFPGHLGANVFRPEGSGSDEWRVIFKFDHSSSLRRWEESEERKAWYARGRELAQDEPRTQTITGLEAWFALPGQVTVTPPPRHKMALVAWLAVYPLITAISALLGPVLLDGLPLLLCTLVLTAIMVPAMFYVVMPR